MSSKTCTGCVADKSVSEFYQDAQKSDRLSSRCRECLKSAAARRYQAGSTIRDRCDAYKAAHPDKQRAYVRKCAKKNRARLNAYYSDWRKRFPDRALAQASARRVRLMNASGLPIDGAQLAQRFEVFGNRCAYCDGNGPLTVDHVIPLSRGGLHILANIRPCCRSCNSSKNNKPLRQWLDEARLG